MEGKRLFKIKTRFLGKDLYETTTLEYIIAQNDEEVYDHINEEYCYGDWPEGSDMTREEIMEARGDFQAEYRGEFYDQKYGWEQAKELESGDEVVLKKYGIVE